MRTRIALAIVIGVAVAQSSLARQQQPPRGVVIETIEKGSAPDLAGLKAGDELISWTRSASARAGAATGEFGTPFDTREFEIEQLPRGGTSIAALRDGTRIDATLGAGYWGVTVRPAFFGADLTTYTAGATELLKNAAAAETAWAPLLGRLLEGGDRAGAAWLLSQAASAFVAQREVVRADELFERAASLLRDPANASFEAVVWEVKGRAYESDIRLVTPSANYKMKRPLLESALAAFERAGALRVALDQRRLAVAESDLQIGWTGQRSMRTNERSVPKYRPTAEEYVKFEHFGERIKRGLATVVEQAPGSFAHARAQFLLSDSLAPGYGYTAVDYDDMVRQWTDWLPVLRQTRSLIEEVAPTHELLIAALRNLRDGLSYASRQTFVPGAREEMAAAARREMRLAEDRGDRTLWQSAAMNLSLDLGHLGDHDEAVSIMEALWREMSLPPISKTLSFVRELRDAGDLASAERVLTLLLVHLEDSEVGLQLRSEIRLEAVRVARARGDFDAARAMALQGLTADEIANPTSTLWLSTLSSIAEQRGDKAEAKAFFERLVAKEGTRLAALNEPPSPFQESYYASTLFILAGMSNDLANYERLGLRALELARATGPDALGLPNGNLSLSLRNAGLAASRVGNLDQAEAFYLEALAINRKFPILLGNVPDTLHRLGDVAQRKGNTKAALQYFEEALALREAKQPRRDSPSWGGTVNATPMDWYADVVGMLVAGGRVDDAFEVAERARSRAQSQMLAQRDFRESDAVSPQIRREQRRLEAAYEEAQTTIEQLGKAGAHTALDAAKLELHKLRLQLTSLEERIRVLDPRAASLRNPQPMTLAEVRASLDPGTVLLSYLVGTTATHLFVVTPPRPGAPAGETGLAVHTLPVDEPRLREAVGAFRTLINWNGDAYTPNRDALLERGRALYDLLVRPAEREIGAADRVLLSVNGPLLALPFEALVRDQAAGPQYLIQWKPFHRTNSLTAYAETVQSRRPVNRTGPLVAFGDPQYPPARDQKAEADLQQVFRAGAMTPLPSSRREVLEIVKMFAPRATTYLGDAATESQVLKIDRSAKYIHFAVHGFVNEQVPLNSALVLTVPQKPIAGEPNGLLQAWEIFQHMHLDADLVTLSACESGLGKEVAGEGLVGLARAFLYAGARSVAASLWKVADGPTAELMTRFYRNLRDGQTKDQALRNAQVALIKMGRPQGSSIDYSSPAHWAAFTLTGDWK